MGEMSDDYAYWRDLNLASMMSFYREIAKAAPQAETVEREGMIAAINPGTPQASIFNGVVYSDPAALDRGVVDELAAAYEDAGVKAWTVWVPDRDFETRSLMIEAGHNLDTVPRIMGRELDDLDPHSMDGIDWNADGDGVTMTTLNDLAYGLPEGTCATGFGELSQDAFRFYVANVDGEPASCVATMDLGSDLGIYGVASTPEVRGKGLSKALTRQALADAKERGLKTTTLQASKLGRPIYVNAGYRDYGCFEMWERRERE
jgi:predicted GNAT family acetyltransferase